MKIAVPVNLVPDLVEELKIDASGAALDMTWARLKVNEFDDHAIEQAILLKERGGGEVIVLAPDLDGSDDVLFTAAARGADQLIKLTGGFEGGVNSHALARAFTAPLKELGPDLVLVGVQAHKDLDGQVGPLLAEYLEFPYVGYVSGVAMEGEKTVIKKEYPGGLIAKMEVSLPAVLGIQASDEPPRYVAFSKVRQAMKTASIQEHEVAELDPSGSPTVARMFQPEVGERATMLEGGVDEVAAQLVKIMKERSIL
jgi:electron transfer flavoprotein beta subunit